MDAPRCPICESAAAPIGRFDVADLALQYRRQLSVDIRGELSGIRELRLFRCPDCDFRFFLPRTTASEKFYEALQQGSWYYLEDKPEFATARRHLKPSDRVLDVGCGSGAFGAGHPAANYLGLEYNSGAVAKVRARGLTVLQQSVESYAESRPQAHDAVCAFQVLEHVENQKEFIQACLDACRGGGKIIFSTPNADGFMDAVKNCVLNCPPHHTARFSRKLWLNLPRFFPMKVVEIIDEPLEPVHQPLYAATLIQKSWETLLGRREFKDIDCTLRHRLLFKLARVRARWLAPGLADPRLQPKGASITAVFEKL